MDEIFLAGWNAMSEEERDALLRRFERTTSVIRFIAWAVGGIVLAATTGAVWANDLSHDVKDLIESRKAATAQINEMDTSGSSALRAHMAAETESRKNIELQLGKQDAKLDYLIRELAPRPK